MLSAGAAPVAPGSTFHGRYRILDILGQGGMGTVYLAEDQVTGDQVCLKVIRPEYTGSASLAQRFLREGKLTRTLRHENVVAVYDVNVASGHFYIVMEHIRGEPMREWLKRALSARTPASLPVATAITMKILAGLEHAHGAGLIHRDLKPENVMLLGDPEKPGFDLKVLDFGLVRDIGSGTMLTAVGASMGTPVYMAPEQETGADVAGPEADLYAVGVMFYELLIGIPPRGRWELPSRIRSDLPAAVDPFCEKALKSHPAHRYGSVAEFRDALQDLSLPRREAPPTKEKKEKKAKPPPPPPPKRVPPPPPVSKPTPKPPTPAPPPPRPSAPTPPPRPAPRQAPPPGPSRPMPPPMYAAPPPAPRKKSKVLVAIPVLLLLALAGYIGVNSLLGRSAVEARTPEDAFWAVINAVRSENWRNLYSLTPPSERAEAEDFWEYTKQDEPGAVEMLADQLGIPYQVAMGLSTRDIFVRLMEMMTAESPDAVEALARGDIEVVAVEEVGDGRAAVEFSTTYGSDGMFLIREGGRWFVGDLLPNIMQMANSGGGGK